MQADVSDRFWSKVDKSGECWVWTARRFTERDGTPSYGSFWYKTGNSRANRMAWILTYGPIPQGLFVLHACDNPPCVRPDHLYLGTPRQNMVDKMARGRGTTGALNGRARLTENDVRAIRRRFANGERQMTLAREYGVHKATMNGIVWRQTWKLLDD